MSGIIEISQNKLCPFCGGVQSLHKKDCYIQFMLNHYAGENEGMPSEEFYETSDRLWNTRQDGWISVNDRLPIKEDNEKDCVFSEVITTVNGEDGIQSCFAYFYPEEKQFMIIIGMDACHLLGVTDWKFLPKPKTTEE